ncbi:MAG TPA: TrkH family potassium uptake protein [Longimicrobiales bacterium]
MYSPVLRRLTDRWTGGRGRRATWWRRRTAPQLFVGSFLVLILVGTVGLRVLPGLYTGDALGWVDALFTATSAVCVTGLIVVDTATYFTPLGQGFLLLLIQIGGLGMITFTTVIILMLGRRISLRQESAAPNVSDIAPHINVRRLTRDILLFTFSLEFAGATLLFLGWAPQMGADAVWPALFHAVSAFCNAGFSIFSDSLVGARTQPLILLTVMTLVVVGGIGFLTMEELWLRRAHRRRRSRRQTDELVPRLTLHSRLVIATTAVLLIGGCLFFTFYEWRLSFDGLPIWARIMNGMFMSVTARTAGFNTIDYAAAAEGSNFLTILLMFIGGSPGSTAGGVKVTTFAVIGLLAWSRYRGGTAAHVAGRTIPEETIQRAIGLFVLAFGVITLAIFLFTTTETGLDRHLVADAGILSYMFEAVSAFGTVGLSMGVTPELSKAGRILTIVLMYVGRVGVLTFVAAIALRTRRSGPLRYAHEDVVIG